MKNGESPSLPSQRQSRRDNAEEQIVTKCKLEDKSAFGRRDITLTKIGGENFVSK